MAFSMATRIKKWTLRELHRLPDDGNKYELVRGELFVTPPPSYDHETILAVLTDLLAPYVRAHGLGHVFHPKSVLRFEGSEVEPDLMVRAAHPDRRGNDSDWDRAPVPILLVEVASDHTRRRDRREKKSLYLDAGVEEYWMVDSESRAITIVRNGQDERVVARTMHWQPTGVDVALEFDVAAIFQPTS